MRWPWSRRQVGEPDAVREAQKRLDAAERKDPEVNWLAEQLKEIRDGDRLAAMLRASFGERK